MPELVQCPSCERKLKVPETLMGQPVQCPRCGTAFTAGEVPPGRQPAQAESEFADLDDALPSRSGSSVRRRSEEHPPTEEEIRDRPQPRKRYEAVEEKEEEDDYDEEDRPRRRRRRRRRLRGEPHRGPLILILGILSIPLCLCPLVSFVLGTAALTMANTDLDKMSNGDMDDSGAGLTRAGQICGIVGIVCGIINCILGVVLRVADL